MIAGLLQLVGLFVVIILSSVLTFLVSPYSQHFKNKVKEKSFTFRTNCWDYAVETSSDFLSSILTNPKVEPLVVNAISKAIDLWVSENSNDVKSTAKALPEKARGNIKMALDLVDDSYGTNREMRGKIKENFFDKIGAWG